MKNISKVLILSSAVLLSACGMERTPAYVSPLEYKDYSCNQLAKEMAVVSAQIDRLTQQNTTMQVLNTGLQAYAISQNSIYAHHNNPNSDEIERLNAKYDALHKAEIQKNCI